MKYKSILFVLLLFLFFSFTESRKVTVFMIGDSTMADKELTGGNPERGWGQMLPVFFAENMDIDNHAVNGRSTKSFIDEGRWDVVLSKIKPGDYVFIQFGHNDQKLDIERHTDPGSTFNANLKRFVNDTREKGGTPVLFTSIVRRHFEEGGQLIDTHGAYLEATRNVASEINVLLIDLNQLTHEWVSALGDEPSRAYFMWIEKQTLPCFPEGKQDNTHLNTAGAKIVASLAARALAKKEIVLASYLRDTFDFVVAQDGSGDFFTIQEAIMAVPDYRKEARTRILIRKGTYREKLIVPESKINVSLIGENETIITYDDYATKKNIFGENKSTSGSSTTYFYGMNLYVEGITFQNAAGPVGQAVAAFICGDRMVFKHCRFLGFQDTLYTYGMKSRQYYEECYIEGTVDFIFGWSTAVFNRCTIHSKGNGYITAPATPEGEKYGYVFYDCELTADIGVDRVYLSRPWRNYAKAVFIRCDLGKHIVPEGWHNWGRKEAESTVFYAEYASRGEGADSNHRALFSSRLSSSQGYEVSEIMAGKDGWNPLADPETLTPEKR